MKECQDEWMGEWREWRYGTVKEWESEEMGDRRNWSAMKKIGETENGKSMNIC